jgi:hypothetical protein
MYPPKIKAAAIFGHNPDMRLPRGRVNVPAAALTEGVPSPMMAVILAGKRQTYQMAFFHRIDNIFASVKPLCLVSIFVRVLPCWAARNFDSG